MQQRLEAEFESAMQARASRARARGIVETAVCSRRSSHKMYERAFAFVRSSLLFQFAKVFISFNSLVPFCNIIQFTSVRLSLVNRSCRHPAFQEYVGFLKATASVTPAGPAKQDLEARVDHLQLKWQEICVHLNAPVLGVVDSKALSELQAYNLLLQLDACFVPPNESPRALFLPVDPWPETASRSVPEGELVPDSSPAEPKYELLTFFLEELATEKRAGMPIDHIKNLLDLHNFLGRLSQSELSAADKTFAWFKMAAAHVRDLHADSEGLNELLAYVDDVDYLVLNPFKGNALTIRDVLRIMNVTLNMQTSGRPAGWERPGSSWAGDKYGWIGDEIMDAWFYLLCVSKEAQGSESIFLPSYFIRVDKEGFGLLQDTPKKAYEQLRHLGEDFKTAGAESKFKRLIFAVNVGMKHWVLMNLDVQSMTLQIFDSSSKDTDLHRRVMKLGELIAAAMTEVLQPCFQDHHPQRNFTTVDMPYTPQQKNGFDCGIFTMVFAARLCAGKLLKSCMPNVCTDLADLITSRGRVEVFYALIKALATMRGYNGKKLSRFLGKVNNDQLDVFLPVANKIVCSACHKSKDGCPLAQQLRQAGFLGRGDDEDEETDDMDDE